MKRWLVFSGLLAVVTTAFCLWAVAYLRANYPPYDPQALYRPSISRMGVNGYWMEISPSYRVGDADTGDHPERSKLLLYEDGVLLGPPHTGHGDIAALGAGRYSHWFTNRNVIVFSASDNSDPRANGRVYRIVSPR